MQTPRSIQAFQPRYPLWSQIKEYLKPQEEIEVRAILGERMLERNSLAHQEVESLLSIVYELQNLNSAKYDKKMKDRYLREQKQRAQERSSLLAPEKKLVKDQIKFFISNLNLLQPRSLQNGDADVIDTVASTPREREILNNVLPERVSRVRPTSSPSKFRLPSRPPSSPSPSSSNRKKRDPSPKIKIDMSHIASSAESDAGDDSTTSSMSTLPNSSRPSTAAYSSRSVPIGVLEKVEGFLNVFDIDHVVSDIKALFENEYKELMEDVDYLRSKLEEEHQNTLAIEKTAVESEGEGAAKRGEEPTLNELRKMSAKLEHTYLNQSDKKRIIGEPPSNDGRRRGSRGRAKLASLRAKQKSSFNNGSRDTMEFHDSNPRSNEVSDEQVYKPKKGGSSRLRKRLQAAKVEDEDAKYFI